MPSHPMTEWGKAWRLFSGIMNPEASLITRDKVLTAIKKKLTANGIDLPFPTQQILFRDRTGNNGNSN